MVIKNLKDIPQDPVIANDVKGVMKQLPISSADGTPLMSMRVFTLEPGGHTPYHVHSQEHINYVIEGSGALIDEDGNEHPLTKGDFALVFPNEKHQYKNTGPDGDFVMICAVKKEYE